MYFSLVSVPLLEGCLVYFVVLASSGDKKEFYNQSVSKTFSLSMSMGARGFLLNNVNTHWQKSKGFTSGFFVP